MLRDLVLGAGLVLAWQWWTRRQQSGPAGDSPESPNAELQQTQQALLDARQALETAQAQTTQAETQIAELNQLATDRAIELVQLRADNADLVTQVTKQQQSRKKKRSTAKSDETVAPAVVPSAHEPLALDPALIQQKQQEAAAATELLTPLFSEESVSPPASNPLSSKLDPVHHAFCQALEARSVWPRADLEAIAKEQGILLDGALEAINDLALDCCDDTLTEGEDPIELNASVLQELMS